MDRDVQKIRVRLGVTLMAAAKADPVAKGQSSDGRAMRTAVPDRKFAQAFMELELRTSRLLALFVQVDERGDSRFLRLLGQLQHRNVITAATHCSVIRHFRCSNSP